MSFALSPRVLHIGRLALPVTLLILIFYFTISSSKASSTHSFSLNLPTFTSSGRRNAFIKAAVETEIDGPFDNSSLVELCASKTWTPGLIFKCEADGGGIVEARNVVLNCLRFGIEAGAPNFIIPEIIPSDSTESPSAVPFSHFFDLPYFTTTLSNSCPQINIIPHINDLWDKPSTSPAVSITPNKFPSTPQLPLLHDSILAKPQNWTSAFKLHLNATHPRPATAQQPVLVNLSPPPLLQFPMSYDSPHFIANFGKLVRTDESLRGLAGTVLYAFSQKHNLNIRPARGIERAKYYSAVSPPAAKADDDSVGRTRSKAISQEEMARIFINAAQRVNLSAIYLSTTHPSDPSSPSSLTAQAGIEKFRTLAANASLALSTAEELLGGPFPAPYLSEDREPVLIHPQRPGAPGFETEWKTYLGLTSAQKEAVDYEILIRGTQFGGSSLSSLSWGCALRRHVISSGGAGKWRSLVPGMGSGRGHRRAVGADEEVEKAKEAQDRKMAPGVKKLTVERSFKDELSSVFGGRNEGVVWDLGGWP